MFGANVKKTIIFVALLVSGCTTAALGVANRDALKTQRPITDVEANQLIEGMRQTLFDPYSVRDLQISTVIELGKVPTVCVKGNPKNRMGGYVGLQTVMVYMPRGRRYWINQDVFAVSVCNELPFRRFHEADRLQDL